MRRLFTAEESGLTRSALRWGERRGRWRRAACQVYAEGGEPLSAVDVARARVRARCEEARGRLAAVLHELDAVTFGPSSGRRWISNRPSVMAGGVKCADGLVTLVDLAAQVDDLVWEQALESALRKKLTTIEEIEAALPELGAARVPGIARIRRVLALRPKGAPPTESLLETLMVQLARRVPGLPEPVRQYEVYDEYRRFVARVDLAWPDLGLFIELDGQHHPGQPVYDARRQTAVTAATGWLCGRFTWHEVVHVPVTTARRLADLAAQARRGRRPAA